MIKAIEDRKKETGEVDYEEIYYDEMFRALKARLLGSV